VALCRQAKDQDAERNPQTGCISLPGSVVNRIRMAVPRKRRSPAAVVRMLCAVGVLLGAGLGAGSRAVAAGAPDAGRAQIVLPSVGPGGNDLVLDAPPWPQERDLVELQQGVRPNLRFFVDRRSLELLPDGEIRYVFLVRSRAGASNFTWETMRCQARERIILATGTAERRWSAARLPRWESIERNDATGMRELLYRDIFCPGRRAPPSLRHLQTALETGMAESLKSD